MSRGSELKKDSDRLKTLPKGNFEPKKGRSYNLTDSTVEKLKALAVLKTKGNVSEMIAQLVDADYNKNMDALALAEKARKLLKS